MRIIFLLSGVSIGGGTRVVLEHSERLREKGHAVWILFPYLPSWKGLEIFSIGELKYYLKQIYNNAYNKDKVNIFGRDVVVTRIPFMHEMFIPDADVVIATQWSTAYVVNKLSPAKGAKAYFIQGYETFTGPQRLVESTYGLPLHKIVVARWLGEILKDKFGQETTLVMNGVDRTIFYNDGRLLKNNKRKRVLMLYHSNPIKGIQDGIQAFSHVKKDIQELDLVMFGAWKGKDVPEWVEFYENPGQELIRELYCTSDVFVCPSKVEGFALPPMEAMSCKLPTVLTNVGAVRDYSIPGKTALISEPGDIYALSDNILRIVTDGKFAKEIAEAGYEHIKQFTWEKSNQALEKVLYGIARQKESV